MGRMGELLSTPDSQEKGGHDTALLALRSHYAVGSRPGDCLPGPDLLTGWLPAGTLLWALRPWLDIYSKLL